MTGIRPAEILRQLEHSGSPDGDLLARFVATKDAAAFAELVRRHGALVLGVCRRVTGQVQDAEDAFQATFLVLAKKAATLRTPALLGNWLYGVAFRVAWKAKRAALRRRSREVPVSTLPEPPVSATPLAMPELTPILDEELAALPEHYRDAIVLCDLRGASREEAAAALGIPEGTLSSRLANGRKKLAVRLTKRGVALSAAALPISMTTAQAAVSVPNDLVTKTCGLVSDWSAGGAVPGPLARLAEGGFAVRKTLMVCAVMLVAVAGAVFAARPNDDQPRVDPPKPPIVAERAEADPQPKIVLAPDPKPGDKPAVTYTSTPKLERAFDLSLGSPLSVLWGPTGTHLGVAGQEFTDPKDRGPVDKRELRNTMRLISLNPPYMLSGTGPDINGQLIAVLEGNTVVTDLREYHLISGHHQLKFWNHDTKVIPAFHVARSLKLEPTETHGYAFTPDGKTYRTVVWVRDAGGVVTSVEVIEVDAGTGKTLKSLLKGDFPTHFLSPDGKRFAAVDKEWTKLTVYDLDRGAKLSEYKFPGEKPAGGHISHRAVFSPDGRRLVVSRGVGETFVLNADTGEALPALDGLAKARTVPKPHAFTADGRLLVLIASEKGEPRPIHPKSTQMYNPTHVFTTVWDTQTGKALKTWTSAPDVAFCPTRPLLAILESNGLQNTRVGFWDFAAEVEKK